MICERTKSNAAVVRVLAVQSPVRVPKYRYTPTLDVHPLFRDCTSNGLAP